VLVKQSIVDLLRSKTVLEEEKKVCCVCNCEVKGKKCTVRDIEIDIVRERERERERDGGLRSIR